MAENAAPEKKKGKFGRKVKGLFGELKKVTWPSFSKVVSQTGVVLAVTLFFLVVLMLMDLGLQQLYKLLTSGLSTESVQLAAAGLLKGAGDGLVSIGSSFPLL